MHGWPARRTTAVVRISNCSLIFTCFSYIFKFFSERRAVTQRSQSDHNREHVATFAEHAPTFAEHVAKFAEHVAAFARHIETFAERIRAERRGLRGVAECARVWPRDKCCQRAAVAGDVRFCVARPTLDLLSRPRWVQPLRAL